MCRSVLGQDTEPTLPPSVSLVGLGFKWDMELDQIAYIDIVQICTVILAPSKLQSASQLSQQPSVQRDKYSHQMLMQRNGTLQFSKVHYLHGL